MATLISSIGQDLELQGQVAITGGLCGIVEGSPDTAETDILKDR